MDGMRTVDLALDVHERVVFDVTHLDRPIRCYDEVMAPGEIDMDPWRNARLRSYIWRVKTAMAER